jgi:hypothetical protein
VVQRLVELYYSLTATGRVRDPTSHTDQKLWLAKGQGRHRRGTRAVWAGLTLVFLRQEG